MAEGRKVNEELGDRPETTPRVGEQTVRLPPRREGERRRGRQSRRGRLNGARARAWRRGVRGAGHAEAPAARAPRFAAPALPAAARRLPAPPNATRSRPIPTRDAVSGRPPSAPAPHPRATPAPV